MQGNNQAGSAVTKSNEEPLCLAIAKRGIKTSRDFAGYMSALMSDLVEGKISPGVGNAAVNAGGKLLKVVEMEMKYGQSGKGTGQKSMLLIGNGEATEEA